MGLRRKGALHFFEARPILPANLLIYEPHQAGSLPLPRAYRTLMRRAICLLIVALSFPMGAIGQAPASSGTVPGAPYFFEHFASEMLPAVPDQDFPQNFAVTQDAQGLVYVANNNGVLQYDGVAWRVIEVSQWVRSLATDAQGTVYVGAIGDLGYLEAGPKGSLRYASLLEFIPEEDRDFTEIWATLATRDGVYFQSRERLFRWDGREMRVWRSRGDGFHTAFSVRGQLFVREIRQGLKTVVGNDLRFVPGGEDFRPVFMMVPYDAKRILIGMRSGFVVYDGRTFEPLPTAFDHRLNTDLKLYHGAALPDGTFALATHGGGVLIMNRRGHIVQQLNEASSFPENWVNYVFTDRQGGLWAALNAKGVVRADVPSQLTVFDKRHGLDGFIHAYVRHEGRLLVATSTGLFVERDSLVDLTTQARFRPVTVFSKSGEAVSSAVWSFFRADDGLLLAATGLGVAEYRQGSFYLLSANPEPAVPINALWGGDWSANRTQNPVFVGRQDGLSMLWLTPGGWRFQKVPGVAGEVRSIVGEPGRRVLWVSDNDRQVWRLSFEASALRPQIRTFGPEQGLPAKVNVNLVFREPLFVSHRGAYRLNRLAQRPADRFEQAAFLDVRLGEERSLWSVHAAPGHAEAWLVYDTHVEAVRRRAGGAFVRRRPAVLRFPKVMNAQALVDPDGRAWLSNGVALLRYDPYVQKPYTAPFHVLVRRITTAETDSLIYDGAPVPKGSVAVFDHKQGNLRVEVAAPTYNLSDLTEYRFWLEGSKEGWTEWTRVPRRIFPNLWEGRYTLRVQARNAQGVMAIEAAYAFRLLPPWYRTWWSYALFTSFVLSLIMLLLHHRQVVEENKRVREQARELARERLVKERLQLANQQLQTANERLRQANQLKDEFLANTSHELRTPLTAIIGYAAVLREEVSEEYHEFLGLIEESGQRLMQTLNALLDFAKLQAGAVDVNWQQVDLVAQTQGVMRLLHQLAEKRGLYLRLDAPQERCLAWVDPHYYERILINLVGNAIKFTDEGGVNIRLGCTPEVVTLAVADTGIGMDEDFMPHLFKEFKQESTGLTRMHEGSGLGLAITKRLVEVMRGTIRVESVKDKGSVFVVTLPATPPQRDSAAGDGLGELDAMTVSLRL